MIASGIIMIVIIIIIIISTTTIVILIQIFWPLEPNFQDLEITMVLKL